MTFILVIAYGGQDEIIRSMKRYIMDNLRDILRDPTESLAKLNEATFLPYLDFGGFPSSDLIIRTGGSHRTSGFSLYQSEYSEYYFTDTLWPDFNKVEFLRALDILKHTKKNFGR